MFICLASDMQLTNNKYTRTYTHLEVIVVFQLQQWLGEGDSLLRYTYIHHAGWMVRGSNSGWVEIFCTRPDRSWGPISLLENGYRVSFQELERPGCGVDHPHLLAPRSKEEYNFVSTPPLGLHCLL
jgi:hypothetical protein